MKSFIKYLLISAGFIALCYSLSGCSVNQQFIETCEDSWSVIGPEYIGYVNADEALDSRTRDMRIRTATGFTLMLEAAKK